MSTSGNIGQHGAHQPDSHAVAATIHAQQLELRHRPIELLHALTVFVNYELGRRRAMGQLEPEDLLRDEVIDAAFAAALGRLDQGEPIRDLHSYLRTRAQDHISREVRRVANERRTQVSLYATVSTGEGGEEGGEEVRVMDVIPDAFAREPEQVVVNNERLQFLIEALADVPDVWRTVFLQRVMQERSAKEVADSEGLDPDEVRRITVRTRDYLRERYELEYDIPED